ncbi:midnolin-like [Tachysurus vachellii]|uniref:midnolin-like n=1 Tax=Tachysurus vachellii TaxID=175792 RepID=UPI00296AB362|nr:midnolin-like [Tachysurus vachellii]
MEQHAEARGCTGHGSRSRCTELLHNEHCMHLSIQSTTGTRFELSLPAEETVDGLKRRLSQKLRVSKDRLALLHKDTRLSSGRLQDFGVTDGTKLTLVPSVEAGLMSQVSKPEQSIMQALESLTETQVGDFLSGRSPLTLALRVGDHMMFVQLQLAAQNSGVQQCNTRGPSNTPRNPAMPCGGSSQQPHTPPTPATAQNNQRASTGHHTHHAHHTHHTQHSYLSPPSSPTLSPGSVHYPHLPTGACSPAPRAAAPFQQGECGSSGVSGSTSSWPGRKAGAVIESFVNHAPGVFSGTFSGTLHPNCQDSTGRPRRDISTILQILNDLLSATRHYPGTPPTLAQLRCHTQTPVSPPATPPASPCPPPSPTVMELPLAPVSPLSSSPTSDRPALSQGRIGKPLGEPSRQTENRVMRCKVERLQLLLQQRRLRRRARREPRAPYHWLSERKSTRSHSNSSLSSDGSIDMDYDEALWKNDVQADIGSEFVVA